MTPHISKLNRARIAARRRRDYHRERYYAAIDDVWRTERNYHQAVCRENRRDAK